MGDLCSIPGLGRFPGRERLPTPVFLPEEFHGQRSLAGYSPWGRKELDTTERLSLSYIRCVTLEKLLDLLCLNFITYKVGVVIAFA